MDAYYRNLTNAWNYLVRCTQTLLEGSGCPEIPSGTPSVVRQAVATIKRIVRATGSIKMGNPRANLVEPQLGYCLREIESGLQKGLGCGHGLVAIFEVVK